MLAQRVRIYREAHGWSADDLAERCTAAGVPLTSATIANLEDDARSSLSVQELLTLAFILSVPPVLLFLPVGEDYEIEVTPGVAIPPDAAVRWVCGEAMMAGDTRPGIWQRFARPLHLYHQLDAAHAQRWNAENDLQRLRRAGRSNEQRAGTISYSEALTNVATVLTAMVECGMTVPPVQDYTALDMAKLGLSLPPGVPTVATEQPGLL
ncbi:MAG: helix-turn-helix domain-containing protein [Mycobacteriales bacterium]